MNMATDSTTSTPATVDVPTDLLPTLRESARLNLGSLGDSLERICNRDADGFAALISDVERAISIHRALEGDGEQYPCEAVLAAVTYTIEDAASTIAEDHLGVDDAEMYVRRIRACEALRAAVAVAAA